MAAPRIGAATRKYNNAPSKEDTDNDIKRNKKVNVSSSVS